MSFSLRFSSLLSILLAGCFFHPHAKTLHFHGIAMTIPYHITVVNSDEETIQKTISETFCYIHAIFDKWNPDSEISLLNNWTLDEPFQCSQELWHLLVWSDFFHIISDGTFDPTINPLESLWIKALEKESVPSEKDLSELRVGWEKIQLMEGQKVKKLYPEVQIDLGAIAKGYAVDLLVKRLETLHCQSIYVEWGGEIRVRGDHPENRPWRIGIFSPEKRDAVKTIELENASLATSGDYFQYWDIALASQKRRFFHLFSAKDKRPLECTQDSISSVTVQHEECMIADAVASILLMAKNEEEAKRLFHTRIQPILPTLRYEAFSWCHQPERENPLAVDQYGRR
jgi:FAD:protein FMN transferase